MLLPSAINTVFSRSVTAAMLVSPNKGTTAMFVVLTGPLGIELYSYAKVSLFWLKNLLINHVREITLLFFSFWFTQSWLSAHIP